MNAKAQWLAAICGAMEVHAASPPAHFEPQLLGLLLLLMYCIPLDLLCLLGSANRLVAGWHWPGGWGCGAWCNGPAVTGSRSGICVAIHRAAKSLQCLAGYPQAALPFGRLKRRSPILPVHVTHVGHRQACLGRCHSPSPCTSSHTALFGRADAIVHR